jgi:hypothetical protein
LSKSSTREKRVSFVIRSTNSGRSQDDTMSLMPPRIQKTSCGASPTTWYAIATSPLRAYSTSGICTHQSSHAAAGSAFDAAMLRGRDQPDRPDHDQSGSRAEWRHAQSVVSPTTSVQVSVLPGRGTLVVLADESESQRTLGLRSARRE